MIKNNKVKNLGDIINPEDNIVVLSLYVRAKLNGQ